MNFKLIGLTLAFSLGTLSAFTQDTTGGTRPNIVIPLKKVVPSASAALPDTSTAIGAPASADERKLRNMARAKKRGAKKQPAPKLNTRPRVSRLPE